MLSISEAIKGVTEAVAYYTKQGKEAYYLAGIGKVGHWFGQAVALLKLPETVQPETFRNLLSGYSPDGKQALVQNAGDPDRDAAWDLTFSSPKPPSVLWAASPGPVRREIEASHRHAVETTLKYAEELWGFTRRGAGGKIHEHAALLFATFEEYVSRAQDMQIHTHCVLINTTVRRDGTTGALHSINFFRAKILLGAVYQADYAAQLTRRLGVTIQPDKVGFAIEGIPQAVCRYFSKRRVVIEKVRDKSGLKGPVAAKVIARETRPRKQDIPPAKLFAHWREEFNSLGWGPEQAAKLVQPHPEKVAGVKSLGQAMHEAMAGIPKDRQTRDGLLRVARSAAIACGANGRQLLDTLGRVRLPTGESLLWLPHASKNTSHKSQARQAKVKAEARLSGIRQPDDRRPHPNPSQTLGSTTAQEAKSRERHSERAQGKAESQNARASAGGRTEESRAHQQQGQAKTSEGSSRADQRANEARSKETQGKSARPGRVSREQRARNRLFERMFGEQVDRIFPERQTRERLTRLAEKLAAKYGADAETLDRTLAEMRPGAERSFVHVEKPRLFPDSPLSPIKWWRLSKFAIGDRPRKWGDIRWKKNLILGELRVQQRRLFPRAPGWNPFHGLEIPALRFSLKKSESKPLQQSRKSASQNAQAKRPEQRKEQRQDHTHSQ